MSRYTTNYSPAVDRYYQLILSKMGGNWCLTGKALVYFVRNMSLYNYRPIDITHTSKEVIKVQPCDTERHRVHVPPNAGAVLDAADRNWTEYPQNLKLKDMKYIPRTCNGIFFNDDRRKHAGELIGKMLKCGEKVGIRDKMFLGFGALLGYALIGDILWNDDDVDMNILSDDIPQEQLRAYLMACKEAGLCESRMRGPAMVNGRYVWFSIGEISKKLNGCKACNWFWFKHGGYYWHSKGKGWRNNFDAKGIPESAFDGSLKQINFKGNIIGAPKNIGKCLDWWYGDWMTERSESSKETALLNIEDETDSASWRINRV